MRNLTRITVPILVGVVAIFTLAGCNTAQGSVPSERSQQVQVVDESAPSTPYDMGGVDMPKSMFLVGM